MFKPIQTKPNIEEESYLIKLKDTISGLNKRIELLKITCAMQ